MEALVEVGDGVDGSLVMAAYALGHTGGAGGVDEVGKVKTFCTSNACHNILS